MTGRRSSFVSPVASLSMVLLLAGTTAACSNPWPETRPADFSVRYNFSAGMLPRFWRLEIKGTEGRYRERKDRVVTEFTFKVTAGEADALYAVFRKNRFDRIEEENRGRVYDRGGRSIAASFAGRSYRRSNAGESFIAKSSYAAWGAVSSALNRLRTKVIREHAQQK